MALLSRKWNACSGLIAASTEGFWAMESRPKIARTANHNTMTGPNRAPTLAVPLRWNRNRPLRMSNETGTM